MVLAMGGCSGGTLVDDPPAVVSDPADRGGRGVLVVEPEAFSLTLADRSDGFAPRVPARIHYPASPSALPSKVVLFNHGFAVDIDAYFDTANHLASWGFVVVVPQWDQGIGSRTHQGLADDVSLGIDALQADGFPIELDGITVDLSQVAVVGHSRGGKQAYLAALADDRITAVFGIDPVDALPPFGASDPADYPSAAPELVGGLGIPVAQVGMGRGAEGDTPCAPADEGFAAYFDALPAGALQFELPTAGHNDVLDDCASGRGGILCNVCVPGEDASATQRFVEASLTAFLGDVYLPGRDFTAWLEGAEPQAVVADAVRSLKE